MGFLHSYTTGSAVDGPGIRLVAWTASCMFRCRFCHNPDTWTLTNGMPVTIQRATEILSRYANGLKVMRGGFTLSGGEPLMQDRFAARTFAAAKGMGVHTAIETNGFYSEKLSDAELGTIDLVILDMKAFHPQQHERVTGVASNAKVIEFARRLARLKRPMWVRHVLVPELTDIPEELEALAAFVGVLGVVERVEILPFHQLGRFKWERLGLDYTLAQTEPPSTASVQRAIDIFKAAGLSAC
jgi:pyruvate formate lyase activating enzyme